LTAGARLARAQRTMGVLLQMPEIDIAALEAAVNSA
jgi:hypothetical protein